MPGISGASYYEGSFSNIARSSSGEYVAVSSRGNFYMTWAPGQTYWQPHNRPVARRLQVRAGGAGLGGAQGCCFCGGGGGSAGARGCCCFAFRQLQFSSH
jgi:photosystem II stability/assembly factor-like uncharacterized protein